MKNEGDASSEMVVMVGKSHTFFVDLFGRLIREKPLGTVGGIIAFLLLLTGIFADFLAPFGMNQAVPGHYLQGPSSQHLLGTDNLGRDLLSRIIFGARISLIVGFSAAGLATVISGLIGLLSGFIGGKFDTIVQRFVDGWMCFPWLVTLIVLSTILGSGLQQIIIVLALGYGIGGSRIVRGAVIAIKENVYITAAAMVGCTDGRLLVRHILPNIMAPIIILFTTRMPNVILAEASLSFLGFGIPPPAPSWGGMLSGSGRAYMLMAPWMAIWPGLALAIVVYGINMLGDALRDLLDPRLKGSQGSYGGASRKTGWMRRKKGTKLAEA